MKSRIDKLKYILKKDKHEDLYYYKNNKNHRDKDLPAVIWSNGSRIWYKNGIRHRDNGKPSHIYSDGDMSWYENGNFIKDNFLTYKKKFKKN